MKIIIKLSILLLSLVAFSQSAFAQSYGHGSCSPVADDALVRTYNMAITCGVTDASQDTVVLLNTANSQFNTATQSPPMFTHPDWTAENIGIVFASEYDLQGNICLLYTSPSPRDKRQSRMPSSA